MADASDVLTVSKLERTEDGHAYLLSYAPSPVLGDRLVQSLHERQDDLDTLVPPPSRVSYVDGERVIAVVGLNEHIRPEIEGVLAAVLARANIAAAGITDEVATEQIVNASFERLPKDLP
jgi:hypothetical protein